MPQEDCDSAAHSWRGFDSKGLWAGQGHPRGQWGASGASAHTIPALSPILGSKRGQG